MQELQIADEQKINRIYELASTDEFTRESFEEDLKEATEKYNGYIATASTSKDDKDKRAKLNKLIEAKHRIRIDTKNLLSETPNTWDKYAKSIIAPFEKVVSELDRKRVMGYTELGRKRPIEIQGDLYDKILIYKHKGEVWGVCYESVMNGRVL